MNRWKQFFRPVSTAPVAVKELQELRLLLGKQLAETSKNATSLQDAEFKVFSQWGDDGIIQYLIHKIKPVQTYFVEFGVENYTESNTRFLLLNNNWSGLVMDGSEANIASIRKDVIYWKHDLLANCAFVSAENINELLRSAKVPAQPGIYHIDIDGNDYWVWKNTSVIRADIVIVEYNSLFGSERSITIPYKSNFVRTEAHHSNLYYGASLPALCDLAEEKGYAFVGCNSAGNNAYFVLKEKLNGLQALTAKQGYVRSKFRESRDLNGALTFLSGAEALDQIRSLEVFNTQTGKTEPL